jgi:hypothetical protein
MGLATSGEIDRSFVALAFVLPPSIIPTANRNLRNLCSLGIFHLRDLGYSLNRRLEFDARNRHTL